MAAAPPSRSATGAARRQAQPALTTPPPVVTAPDLRWCQQHLSPAEVAALTAAPRTLDASAARQVRSLAEADRESARAWIVRTRFPMRDVRALSGFQVSPDHAVAWHDALPPMRQHVRLIDLLSYARVLWSAPVGDFDAWVRLALDHRFLPTGSARAFLGGGTAVALAAGLTPDEARRFLATDPSAADAEGLRALAALRHGSF